MDTQLAKIQKLAERYGVSTDGLSWRNVDIWNLHGTLFTREHFRKDKAIIVCGGMSSNRYGLAVPALHFANHGCITFVIEPPGHYLNHDQAFSLGHYAEQILHAIEFLKHSFHVKDVVVLGSSMGATAALLSNCAFTDDVEKHMEEYWKDLLAHMHKKYEELGRHHSFTFEDYKNMFEEVDEALVKLRNMVAHQYELLQRKGPTAVVACGPPISMRHGLMGISLMRAGFKSKRWRKHMQKLLDKWWNDPIEEANQPAGNPLDTSPERLEGYAHLHHFKTKDPVGIFDYFMNQQSLPDYMELIQEMSRVIEGDTIFKKYYNHVKHTRKFFMYGWRDYFVVGTPWRLPWIHRFYRSTCAKSHRRIKFYNLPHLINDTAKEDSYHVPLQSLTHPRAIRDILHFVDSV